MAKIYCGTVNGRYIFKLGSLPSLKREASKVLSRNRMTPDPDVMTVTLRIDGILQGEPEHYIREKVANDDGSVTALPWTPL